MHRPVPIDDVPSSSHQLGSSCFTDAGFQLSADFEALHITLVPTCTTYVTCPRATALLSWIQLCPPAGLTSAHRLHIMHDHIYYFLTVSSHLVCGHLIKTVILRHSHFISSNVTATISPHAPLSWCPSGCSLQIVICSFQQEGSARTLCPCFDIVTLACC